MTRLHAPVVTFQRVDVRTPKPPAAAGTAFAKAFDAVASAAVSGNPASPSAARSAKSDPGRADTDRSSSQGQRDPGEPAPIQDAEQSDVPPPFHMLVPAGGLAGTVLSRVRLGPASRSTGAAVELNDSPRADGTSAGPGHVDGDETKGPVTSGAAGQPDVATASLAATPASVAIGQDGISTLAALLVSSVAPAHVATSASSPAEPAPAPVARDAPSVTAPQPGRQGSSGPAAADGGAQAIPAAVAPGDTRSPPVTVAPQAQAIPIKPTAGGGQPSPVRLKQTMTSSPPSAPQETPVAAAAAAGSAPGGDDAPAAPLTTIGPVAQTTGETAVNPMAGPTQQVLAALRSLGLGSPGETTDSPAAPSANTGQPAAPDRPTAAAAPLHALTIQLQPAHLGAVELTVQRRDGKLAVTVTVGDDRALRTLEKDRDLLASAIAAGGGSRDGLALTLASGPNNTAASSASQSGQAGGLPGAPGDMSQGGAAHGQPRPGPASITTGIEDDQRSSEAATDVRLDRGLYL